VTSQYFLERLAKVILYGTLANTVPFYNISTLWNENNKEQLYNILESSNSRSLVTPGPFSVNFLDFIWNWTSHFLSFWTTFGLGLSFENSGLDLARS